MKICGEETIFFTSTTILNEKTWDNNNLNRHTITTTIFTDAKEGGNIIAKSTGIRSEVGEVDVFPLRFIVEEHNKQSCSNGVSDEGWELDEKIGSTTFKTELGEITHESKHHGP